MPPPPARIAAPWAAAAQRPRARWRGLPAGGRAATRRSACRSGCMSWRGCSGMWPSLKRVRGQVEGSGGCLGVCRTARRASWARTVRCMGVRRAPPLLAPQPTPRCPTPALINMCRPAEADGTAGQPRLSGPGHAGRLWLHPQGRGGGCACCAPLRACSERLLARRWLAPPCLGWQARFAPGCKRCRSLSRPGPPCAAGKDVLQRVGSKGPAADLTRVLVARLTPALLPPEVLHAAMEQAEGSQEGAARGHKLGRRGWARLLGAALCCCPSA